MNVAVAYVVPCDVLGAYRESVARFVRSYVERQHGYPHELWIIRSNGPYVEVGEHMIIPCVSVSVTNNGWDAGAYVKAASLMTHDFVVFVNTGCVLTRNNWLKQLVEAREKHGDGLYAPSASFERLKSSNTLGMNPHLRSPCIACNPAVLRKYPHEINGRMGTYAFESGVNSCTRWFAGIGMPTKMVTFDGCWDAEDWRKPPNIFRRGNQTNCLLWDRHHFIYEAASRKQKADLARKADCGN